MRHLGDTPRYISIFRPPLIVVGSVPDGAVLLPALCHNNFDFIGVDADHRFAESG